jgi:S1-C subfamily serine protease
MKKPVQLTGGFPRFPIIQRGLVVKELEPGSQDKISVGIQGVLVAEVFPKSDAEKGGLLKGDIITSVNDRKVVSQEEFKRAMSEIPLNGSLSLSIYRNQESLQITLPGTS